MAETRVKALIPAAGRGLRLAGLSGGGHKELLPIGPLTMIEHCLKMTIDSGVVEVGIVVRPGKEDVARVAEEYWRRNAPHPDGLAFFEQDPPRGVADAMRIAAVWAGPDPLAVVMPDNLVVGGPPALGRIIKGYQKTGTHTIGVIPITSEQAGLFGNVGLIGLKPAPPGEPARVDSFTRKGPGTLNRPADGDYYKGMTGVVYLPDWAGRIDALPPNHEGEIDDADLVHGLVMEKRIYAVVLEGEGYDLGQPRGLEAARLAWDEAAAQRAAPQHVPA